MIKQVAKKATRAANTWFAVVIAVNLIFMPIDWLFHKSNSLIGFIQMIIQAIGNHNFMVFGVILLTLLACWLVIFLVALFFYWLNYEMSKKDYYQK